MESIVDLDRQGVTCYEMDNMDVIGVAVAVDDHQHNEGCSTPTRDEYKIHVASAPPPPPRKKPAAAVAGRKRAVPKNGYFQPPDLDFFFATAPRPTCKFVHME